MFGVRVSPYLNSHYKSSVLVFFLLLSRVALGVPDNAVNVVADAEDLEPTTIRGFEQLEGYLQYGEKHFLGRGQAAHYEIRVPVALQGYYRVYAWWPQSPRDGRAALASYEMILSTPK